MGWKSVIGQHTVVRLLQQATTAKRLPHALLLRGEDGCGALATSIALARVITCETPSFEGGIDACGHCRSCVQNAMLQHPNVSIITALPPGKAENESELPQDVIDELSHNLRKISSDPYAQFVLSGATQIRIGQIREIKRQLSMSSMQGGKRVVIIHRAETMTVEAANAFLKTLEEPHPDTHLILTSESAERVLPTILSRCQQLTIPPIDDDDIVATLVTEGVHSQDAALVVPFAKGNLTIARAYAREDVQTERAEAIELLRAALKGREFRVGLVEAVSNAADKKDRAKATLILSMLMLWIRDSQSVQVLGNNALLINQDHRDAINRFVDSFKTADLGVALDILDRGVRDVRRNVTVSTALLSTLLELRGHLYASITRVA